MSLSMPKIKEELFTVKKYKVNGAYTDERKEKHTFIIKIILTQITIFIQNS